MKKKTLERGDFVIIDFNPQAGREMMKRRPGIVVSPSAYNNNSAVVLVCPITTKSKGSPWEVSIPEGLSVEGYVRVDHLKSMDTVQRGAIKVGMAPKQIIEEVLAKLAPLIT